MSPVAGLVTRKTEVYGAEVLIVIDSQINVIEAELQHSS